VKENNKKVVPHLLA